MIDLYCERTTPGLWGEPLNTVSNLAFFIAAWAALRLARRRGTLDLPVGLLIVLLLAIGIGSTLFHMFANAWSEWCDVVPILLFETGFILIYLRRVAGMPAWGLAATLTAFLVASLLAPSDPQLLNGSAGYLPALVLLLSLGVYHRMAQWDEPWLLLAAGLLFFVSLVLRSIDNAVCAVLPTGTHMFWHLLNGAVLYLALRACIVNAPRPTG